LNLTKNEEISPDNLAALMVADVIYETTRDDKIMQKHGDVDVHLIISNLSYGRLKKLFDLWDVNHDGDISLAELTMGLKAFHDAAKLDGDPELEARILLKFDSNNDNRLDQREFSEAIVFYAKSFGVELHILIDFMCVTNTMGDRDMNPFQHIFGMSMNNDKSPIQPQKRLSLLLDEDVDIDSACE
jgi:EF hand